MVAGIIAGVIVLALLVGWWLTRKEKAPDNSESARDALLDSQASTLEHGGEAFEDEKPPDY
jgi:hypothetical protein